MKRIIMLATLLSIFSCSTYTIKIESPNEWFKRNFEKKETQNTDDLAEIKSKLESINSTSKSESKVISEKVEETKKITNISSTDIYDENNNFFTKKTEAISNKANELKTEMTNILNKTTEVFDFKDFNSDEKTLIDFISEKVLESKSEVEDLIKNGYKYLKEKSVDITREKYIALLAKYVRDKNINNFTYVSDRVNSEIESGK